MAGIRSGRSQRILLVQHNELLRDALAAALRGEGYRVGTADDSEAVARLAHGERVDLLIVDPGQTNPPVDWSVLRRIRNTSDVPVVALVASSALDDRLEAFRSGADDVLVQPFNLAELFLRIQAVLRRSAPALEGRLEAGDLVVDERAHLVTRGGELVDLTAMEFSLLRTFCRHPRTVLSKAQLLSTVWGFDQYDPNVVEVHVSALRRKMEAHGPRLIHTVRGVGYVLRPEPIGSATVAAVAPAASRVNGPMPAQPHAQAAAAS